jgi:FMN-dependent NADH-azoreductase
LYKERLPELVSTNINGKYQLMSGKELDENLKSSWNSIIQQIERFKSADIYIISTPMWNFGVPYVLKHYIDVIFQPKYLFKYTENGPVGLTSGKLYIISTRGGDYSENSPAHSYDNLEPYLKTAFGFIGFTDITFVSSQPMDSAGEKIRELKIDETLKTIRDIKI